MGLTPAVSVQTERNTPRANKTTINNGYIHVHDLRGPLRASHTIFVFFGTFQAEDGFSTRNTSSLAQRVCEGKGVTMGSHQLHSAQRVLVAMWAMCQTSRGMRDHLPSSDVRHSFPILMATCRLQPLCLSQTCSTVEFHRRQATLVYGKRGLSYRFSVQNGGVLQRGFLQKGVTPVLQVYLTPAERQRAAREVWKANREDGLRRGPETLPATSDAPSFVRSDSCYDSS